MINILSDLQTENFVGPVFPNYLAILFFSNFSSLQISHFRLKRRFMASNDENHCRFPSDHSFFLIFEIYNLYPIFREKKAIFIQGFAKGM